MEDKTGNNDSLSLMESDWITSTPIPFCGYEAIFNSANDATSGSEYESALSEIFTNPKKTLSTIGTKGSPNASDSELMSLSSSLTDDEREYTDQEKNKYSKKKFDFDEYEEAPGKDVSQNTEKTQSSDKIGVCKTSGERDNKCYGIISGFQSCKLKEISCSEEKSENSHVWGKNQNFSESDVCETSLVKEKIMSNVKFAAQNCQSEENSLPEQRKDNSIECENTFHWLRSKQNINTLNKECALKKEGSSENTSNTLFISSSKDLGAFESSPIPLNIAGEQRNNDTSRKSGPFCRKRKRSYEGNHKRENDVTDSVIKSAPPSPIFQSRIARGIYIDSLKRKRESLSCFYSKFKKNISKNRKLRASNVILCKKPKDISKSQHFQKITMKSFQPFQSNKVDKNLLIHTNMNLTSNKELACRPFMRREGNQDAAESQTLNIDPFCFFPYESISLESVDKVQNNPAIEEFLRENSVTSRKNDVLMSKDFSFGLKNKNFSDLCPVIEETKCDSRNSDIDVKLKSLSTSPMLSYDERGDFGPKPKKDFAPLYAHRETLAENFADVQNSSVLEREKILRDNSVTAKENCTASNDSTVEMEKGNTSELSAAICETNKLDSGNSDVDSKSHSLLNFKDSSHPDESDYFNSQTSSATSKTNHSASSNLIFCPFCKNSFSEVTPSKSDLTEEATNENYETTVEYRPRVDTILGLFDVDNTLSKNILLAVLNKSFTKGATYTEIINYLKKEHVFSTKLTGCVKIFLQAAVNANVLRMKRRRYFVVSRDDSINSSFIPKSARRKIFTRKSRKMK